MKQGDPEAALEHYSRALEIYKQEHGAESVLVASTIHDMGLGEKEDHFLRASEICGLLMSCMFLR